MDIAEKVLRLKQDFDDIYNLKKDDEMWEMVQASGTRTVYLDAFQQWGCEYIRPKYKIAPATGGFGKMFYNNKKLKIVEKAYFDFSKLPIPTYQSNGEYYSFQFCENLEVIEDIGLIGKYYIGTFHGCTKLHTIERLPFREDTTFSTNPFHSCKSLVNLTIDGVIATSVDFQWSPLSKESILSIAEHLSDTTTGLTVTLKQSAKESAFTTSEWSTLTATKSNWRFSLI